MWGLNCLVDKVDPPYTMALRSHVAQLIFFATLIKILLRKNVFCYAIENFATQKKVFCYTNKIFAPQKSFFATRFLLCSSFFVVVFCCLPIFCFFRYLFFLQPTFLICDSFFLLLKLFCLIFSFLVFI